MFTDFGVQTPCFRAQLQEQRFFFCSLPFGFELYRKGYWTAFTTNDLVVLLRNIFWLPEAAEESPQKQGTSRSTILLSRDHDLERALRAVSVPYFKARKAFAEAARMLVSETAGRPFLATLPHRDELDGFFAARFRRRR